MNKLHYTETNAVQGATYFNQWNITAYPTGAERFFIPFEGAIV